MRACERAGCGGSGMPQWSFDMATATIARRSVAEPDRPRLPVSSYVLTLRAELAARSMRTLRRFTLRDFEVEVALGQDAVWALVWRPDRGGLALRGAQLPEGATAVRKGGRRTGEALRVEVDCAIGKLVIAFHAHGNELPVLGATTVLTPIADLLVPFYPRDLYPLDADDDPAGQVGQEIYDSGAAFVFASRAFHRFGSAPFTLFCDHFLLAADRPSERTISFQLGGGEGSSAILRLIRRPRQKLPKVAIHCASGERSRPHVTADAITCHVPADGRVSISW